VIVRDLPRHLADLSIVLWVGGMWMLGYVVVPALFKLLPDRMLAGRIAGELFTLLAFIGIVCALYLLLFQLRRFGRAALQHPAFRVTAAMLLLVLIGQLALQPILADLKAQVTPLDVMDSPLAAQFKTWHAVSGIVFLVQSLLGIWLVLVRKDP
jgi:cytochrome bd-type quinol oxidase subunit 2